VRKERAVTIRYIADMHFDSADIIAYDNRPFDSVEELNETLIANWNAVAGPEDLTWILGDFCAGGAERWAELLGRLNGRKAMILGNHDDRETAAAVRHLLADAAEYREIEADGRRVVLCHYPIPSFRDHYMGWYHLYGHVHTAFEWNVAENAKRLLKNLYLRRDVCRMANVGAMVSYMDYTPRTLAELEEHL
jgi:calcineurin-like phosphoesterase family protein